MYLTAHLDSSCDVDFIFQPCRKTTELFIYHKHLCWNNWYCSDVYFFLYSFFFRKRYKTLSRGLEKEVTEKGKDW